MKTTLNQVDQEEKKQTTRRRTGWTAQQYWERLCTEVRLVQRRWNKAGTRAPRPEAREDTQDRAQTKAQTRPQAEPKAETQATAHSAPPPRKTAAARKERPAAHRPVRYTTRTPETQPAAKKPAQRRTLSQLRRTFRKEAARSRRRWNQVTREIRAHRFPESNRRPVQFVLMAAGMVPMVASLAGERVMGRYRRSTHRSGAVRAWLDRRRLRPVVFFAAVGVIAVGALFFSNYTLGTTVFYDGDAVGSVASKMTARSACHQLESVTQEVLGGSYQLSDSQVQYATKLMPRRDLVDGQELQEELADKIGLVSYGYALYIDGELVGATPYEGALDELMQQLKDGVSDENTISCDFQQDIEVKEGYVSADKVMNLGYLAEMLYSTKMEEVTYTVKSGDTWSEIAERNNMTSKELLVLNPGFNINRLAIGDVLTLSAAVPYLTLTVTEREHYLATIPYDVEYTDSANLYKGDEKVLSAGVNGSADCVATVTYVNGEETERTVLSTVTLRQPVTEQRARGTKERPTWLPTGSFRWPCSGNITSRFGYRNLKYSYASKNHKGIDIANRKGTAIYAADGGTVIYAGWMSGYGYLVQIDHGNGYVTYYGHNSSLTCSVGQHVYKGQQIARMGSTGNSTGNHCHFEVRYNGVPRNPLNYLP